MRRNLGIRERDKRTREKKRDMPTARSQVATNQTWREQKMKMHRKKQR